MEVSGHFLPVSGTPPLIYWNFDTSLAAPKTSAILFCLESDGMRTRKFSKLGEQEFDPHSSPADVFSISISPGVGEEIVEKKPNIDFRIWADGEPSLLPEQGREGRVRRSPRIYSKLLGW